MDSDPPRTGSVTIASVKPADTLSEASGTETDGDPHSPIGVLDHAAPLFGSCIGLLALIVPLGCVLSDRAQLSPDAPLPVTLSDGHQHPGRLTVPGSGAPGGGNPGR